MGRPLAECFACSSWQNARYVRNLRRQDQLRPFGLSFTVICFAPLGREEVCTLGSLVDAPYIGNRTDADTTSKQSTRGAALRRMAQKASLNCNADIADGTNPPASPQA